MAMLTHCFFCKKQIVIPSGEETYKLTEYDFEDLNVFKKYKKESPLNIIGEYCCQSCFNHEILPKILR